MSGWDSYVSRQRAAIPKLRGNYSNAYIIFAESRLSNKLYFEYTAYARPQGPLESCSVWESNLEVRELQIGLLRASLFSQINMLNSAFQVCVLKWNLSSL